MKYTEEQVAAAIDDCNKRIAFYHSKRRETKTPDLYAGAIKLANADLRKWKTKR